MKKTGVGSWFFYIESPKKGCYVEEFENAALNQYLSLMKISDKALEELVAYFSNVDEKTVIVFFGDHQPKLEEAFYNSFGKEDTTMESQQKKYKVHQI